MRSRYRIVEEDGIYFLTLTIIEWVPVFTSEETFGIMVNTLAFCRENKGLRLYGYVILDNHAHFVAAAPDLRGVVQSIKRHTAKQILAWAGKNSRSWILNQFEFHKAHHKASSKHQVWQEGFHPQLVQGEAMLRQKLEYIHNNPVRRGYVDVPEHWRYSSARNFLQSQDAVLTIDAIQL
jgi:REP element-mobilizing transposase RayT